MKAPGKLTKITRYITAGALGTCLLILSGCSPEIGSEQWCADLKEKPRGDWTANELGDYAKHCIFKSEAETEGGEN